MKATELRIGNYIKNIFDNEYCQVTPLEIEACLGMEGHFNLTYEPIELSKKILLKCGFEKKIWKEKNSIYFEFNKMEILLTDTYYEKGVTYYKSNLLFEYCPKYLHQLQNLIHALTNEELTVNL